MRRLVPTALAIAGILGGVALVSTSILATLRDPELSELRMDRIAKFVPTGGTLEFETATEAHTSLGKPVKARLFRVFRFDEARQATKGRDDAIVTAVAGGWAVHRSVSAQFDLTYGAKVLATGQATLTIGRYRDDGRDRISILLEHQACPDAMCPSQ